VNNGISYRDIPRSTTIPIASQFRRTSKSALVTDHNADDGRSEHRLATTGAVLTVSAQSAYKADSTRSQRHPGVLAIPTPWPKLLGHLFHFFLTAKLSADQITALLWYSTESLDGRNRRNAMFCTGRVKIFVIYGGSGRVGSKILGIYFRQLENSFAIVMQTCYINSPLECAIHSVLFCRSIYALHTFCECQVYMTFYIF